MTEASTVPPPGPSVLARAIGIITSPRATFEKVVQSPRPVGIMLLVAVVMSLAIALPQFTETGREAALEMQVHQTERWTGQPVSDEQYSRMQAMSRFTPYFSLVSILIGLPIGALVISAIYWVIFNVVMGGAASFKQVLAINTHSMVISALATVIGAPIQYLKGTLSQVGPFTLGAVLPMLDERGFVSTFLGSISVFSIWGLIVAAIGLGVLYKRKTSSIALALFALYGVPLAAFAYFTSGR